MRLDKSVLLNRKYRDPNWRPDPALKVGDSAPHQIDGRRVYFLVVRVFWDGKIWRYVLIPDRTLGM